jgi:predicted transcriptional regulator
LLTNSKKEVKKMPTTMPGRKLVKKYLANNHIKTTDLAKMYGMTKQEVSNYLSGSKTNPKANQFILKVIRDFKI